MWTLNGVRIFVQDDEGDDKQIVARLQPLKAGTYHQIFGYEKPVRKISGLVVGLTDRNALRNLVTTALSYSLVSPFETKSYIVSSVRHKEQQSICQTLRTDLADDAPVYLMDIELFEDI